MYSNGDVVSLKVKRWARYVCQIQDDIMMGNSSFGKHKHHPRYLPTPSVASKGRTFSPR